MRILNLLTAAACVALIVIGVSRQITPRDHALRWSEQNAESISASAETGSTIHTSSAPAPTQRYRLDSSQSKFIAHGLAAGLLWFKGHDHLVAVRDFTGEAQLTPDSISPASLEITAKAGSMVETSSVFT